MRRALAGLLLVGALAGCDSQTPQASQQQAQDFKGGPMPPEFKEKFRQMQKESSKPNPGP